MPDKTPASQDQLAAAFIEKVTRSFADGTFVRLVLSPAASDPEGGPEEPDRILGRCVDLRGQRHLSFTLRYAKRDEVKNLPLAEAVTWVNERLAASGNALLCTTAADWQFCVRLPGGPRLIRHRPSQISAPPRTHDQTRSRMLDASAQDWLQGLGVTDKGGKVRSAMASKHAQIHRYLEIVSHLAQDMGWMQTAAQSSKQPPSCTLVDMGCGKGYLTFGLWHLWHRVWKWPVRVIGVEARPELVEAGNQLAAGVGAEELEFRQGSIASVPLPRVHGLIALHACDTATDDAIVRGIECGAQLILLAPCCHKELRPRLFHPPPLAPVLAHGIMEERMAEWATDGLRALFLEWAGYRAKLFEFVSGEHTSKNLMIAALREQPAFSDPSAKGRLEALKSFFGIRRLVLESAEERLRTEA